MFTAATASPSQRPRVVGWLRDSEAELAVDPIILGEVRFGIHLAAGKRSPSTRTLV